ncbi:MAG: hypothetical protein JSU91_00870 [Thermoplasmatales archaeon]|nr:MAG: hypothetical protein JSU91_00870 [Thermoplasmatales archaeon]
MTKDNKINLKLEVYKDKNSGKLSIKAHFDKSAPNIYKEKESFLWVPTIEEKDFLNEAFKMMPEGMNASLPKDKNSKSEEPKVTEDTSKPETPDKIEELFEEQPSTEDKDTTEKTPDEVVEETPTVETPEDDLITTDEKTEEKDDNPPEVDDKMLEEIDNDEIKTLDNEQDKAMIVEADADAIDEAIKKHTKDDESIVEADEQTIIDRVLSQKKKGKWGRK